MRLPTVKRITGYLFIALLFKLMLACETFADSDIMKPYPLPEAGYDKMVINLEPLGNEDLRKVEILIGKAGAISATNTLMPTRTWPLPTWT